MMTSTLALEIVNTQLRVYRFFVHEYYCCIYLLKIILPMAWYYEHYLASLGILIQKYCNVIFAINVVFALFEAFFQFLLPFYNCICFISLRSCSIRSPICLVFFYDPESSQTELNSSLLGCCPVLQHFCCYISGSRKSNTVFAERFTKCSIVISFGF